MPWSRRLPTSLRLNDGRTLSNLAQARDLWRDLPPSDQAHPHWIDAGELLLQAAYRGRQAALDDVARQLRLALHANGLM